MTQIPKKLGQVNPIPILPYDQEPILGLTDTLYNYVMLLNYGRDVSNFDEAIDYAATLIFNNYPIWDEQERIKLNHAIIVYFLNRDIAFDTWGMFKIKLHNVMNIIMPKYNDIIKLYKMFNDKNILGLEDTETFNEDYREHHDDGGNYTTGVTTRDVLDSTSNLTDVNESELNRSSNTKDVLSNDNTQKFWDTPQLDLNELGDKLYATNITQDNGSSTDTLDTTLSDTLNSSNTLNLTSNTESSGNSDTEHEYSDTKDETHNLEHTRTSYGNNGHLTQSLIKEYRELVISIFEMILNDDMLNNLFGFILYV